MIAVTELERKMLLRFAANDIVSDHGWEGPSARAWSDDLCSTKSDAAVVGSLVRKGLMNTNGESIGLNDTGREALRQIKAS